MRASRSYFLSILFPLFIFLPLSLAFFSSPSLPHSPSLSHLQFSHSSIQPGVRWQTPPLQGTHAFTRSVFVLSRRTLQRKPPLLKSAAGDAGKEEEDKEKEGNENSPAKADLPKSLTVQRIENNSFDDSSLFWFGALFELGLGLTAILFGFILHINPLGPGFSLASFSSSLLHGFLLSLPLSVALLLLNTSRYRPLREIRAVTDALGRRIFLGKKQQHLVLFSCASGFGEELLFRGVLQQGLCALSLSVLGVANTAVAVVLVAVAFAFAHWMTPFSFLLSSLFSIAFSAMFIVSGYNIIVPMAAHMCFDYCAVQLTLRRLRKQDAEKQLNAS